MTEAAAVHSSKPESSVQNERIYVCYMPPIIGTLHTDVLCLWGSGSKAGTTKTSILALSGSEDGAGERAWPNHGTRGLGAGMVTGSREWDRKKKKKEGRDEECHLV